MTLIELTELLASKNIHLIRVSDINDGKGDRHATMSFVGTLDEYIHALEVLGAKAVYVSTLEVTEDFFSYIPNDRSTPANTWPFPGTDEDKDEDEYDLCSVQEGLEKYKTKIGEDGYFDLLACNLSYSLREEWMEELLLLREEAIEIVEEQLDEEEEERKAVQEDVQAEQERHIAHLVNQLHALMADKKFSNLKTQRAMRVYALEQIPELEELGDSRLKLEIQLIAAKIEAGM